MALAALAALALPAMAVAQPTPQPPPQPQPMPDHSVMPPPQMQPQPMPPQSMQPLPGQPGVVVQSGQPGTTVYPGGYQQVIIQAPNQEWIRPDQLPYERGDIVPNGYVVREQMNVGLFVAGMATFGSVYLGTLVTGLTLADNDPGTAALAAPVVGPLIAIGTIDGVEGLGAYLLVVDFLVQASGVAMFSASFASHPAVLRRVGDGRVGTPPAPELQVAARPGGASLSLSF
jgi:hypothetical protein